MINTTTENIFAMDNLVKEKRVCLNSNINVTMELKMPPKECLSVYIIKGICCSQIPLFYMDTVVARVKDLPENI